MAASQSFGHVCRQRLPVTVLSNSTSLFQWSGSTPRQSMLLPSRRFLSSEKKKKRRKSRNLTPVPVTKKDRIRSLEKREDKIEFKLPTVSLEELPDTVESRLMQARKFIYSFWNDDASGAQSGARARPPRVGPVMDARWWFWNLCLALMPAIVIAVYCEFWVEPEMRAYFKAMNEAQKRRIMGDDYVEEEQEDEIVIIPLEKPSLKERMQQSFQELVGLSTSGDAKEDQTIAATTAEKSTIEPATEEAPAELPSTGEETTLKRHEDTQGEERQNSSNADKNLPQRMDDRNMLLLLQQRIDALETQLEKQQRRQRHQLDYQMERAGQSGIQNRIEDRWISEWEEEREQKMLKGQQQKQQPQEQQQQQQQQQPEQQQETRPESNKTSREKMKEAVLRGLRENLSAKKEAMERYGVDIMDRAWGFWENEDDEEENEGAKEDAISKKEARDSHVSSHAEVAKSAEDAAAATNRAAEMVVSSVSSSSDPSAASQAAAQAAVAAEEAAEAAHRAAASVPRPSSSEQSPGIIKKTWSAVFHRKAQQGSQEEQPKE